MTQSHEFKKLSVLIPVYNESRTLETIAARVLDADVELDIEVIMVDDGSTDGSWEIMKRLAAEERRIQIIQHPRNRGKGAAIRTAIDAMTGDVAIVQDADLEYDPGEISRVIRPILDGHADAVYGSRFASSPVRRVLFFWHSLGNQFLTLLFNAFNNLNLTDMETCYKAVRADVLRELRLESERFGIEPEISTRLAQWGARIYEVPISYYGRTYAEGKHIGWRDGLQALWLIVRFRFIDTEYSRTGEASEVSLGSARNYASWVLDRMNVDLDSSVVEVDAGMGNYTRLLLGARSLLVAETNPRLLSALRRKYGRAAHVSFLGEVVGSQSVEGIECASAVSFNGLSTTDDPSRWLRSVASVLESGGLLHVLVPAHADLATSVDDSMSNRRRFSESELRKLLEDSGFEIVQMEQFNRLGTLGWKASGTMRLTRVGVWQARIFSALVPVARRLETVLPGRGLSIIVAARLVR